MIDLNQNKIPSVIYYKFPIHLMKAFKYLGYKKMIFLYQKIYQKQLLVYLCILILIEEDIDLIVQFNSKNEKMKYIVTGGAGFIGSNLVDLLIDEGHEVHVIDNFFSGKKENCNKKAKYYHEYRYI